MRNDKLRLTFRLKQDNCSHISQTFKSLIMRNNRHIEHNGGSSYNRVDQFHTSCQPNLNRLYFHLRT